MNPVTIPSNNATMADPRLVSSPNPYSLVPVSSAEASRLRMPGDDKCVFHIVGPFIDTYLIGTSERCGPEHVKALNLAYRAGQRNPL